MSKQAKRLELVETDGRLLRAAQLITWNSDAGITPRFIPCDPVTKHPPLNGWQALATANLGQLEALYKQYPRATMLSLLVGADVGFFVVDLDAKNNGLANFAKLESKHGKLPRTPECITGSDGRHVFFRFPKGVNIYNRASDIAEGVDIRGSRADGSKAGQAVAAGSINAKGGAYRWAEPWTGLHDLADPPEWLLFLVIFNRAQRARLEALGITGHEGFDGLPPAQWEDQARQLFRAKAPAEWRPTLDSEAGRSQLGAYVTAAATNELRQLAQVDKGKRDSEANKSALRIQSVLKGTALLGLDTTAIGDAIRLRYVETTDALMPEAAPGWAAEKWDRNEVDATPREIRLKKQGSNADDEFSPIDPPAGASSTTAPASLLEHFADVDLEQMIARQSNALVKGVLHPGETCMVYGDSTAGKTFVGIDLGWHVALGGDWHGRRVKRAPVLYVALEGVEGFRKRMLAAGQEHGDPGKWFARFTMHVSLVKSEAGTQGVEKIVEAAELQTQATGQPVGVVMIDTLARATAGDDENATADMMAFVEKRAGEITRRTGAAVVVVHHENRNGSMRGSSSLRGSFDAVLRVERHSPDADTSRRVIAEKVKDDTEGALFDFRLRVVELGTDSDGLPVTSCVLEASAPTAKTEPVKDTDAQKALREALDAAVAAGKGVAHPLKLDAPAALEPAVRECFEAIYPKGRTGRKGEPLSSGAIRKAWHGAIGDLPSGIRAGIVDGVLCLYGCPLHSKPPGATNADDEFKPIDPDDEAEKAPKK